MKIKVAYIVHGLGAEGISAFTANLMSCLDMNKFDVTIIMAVDDNGQPQLKEEQVASYGVRFYRTCDLGSFKRIRQHKKRLKELLISTGPYDVVHVNMDMLNGINLQVAKKVGIPTRISHSHRSMSDVRKSFIKRVIASIYYRKMRGLIKCNATLCVGCSELANEYLYGKNPATVIANGIDVTRFLNCNVDVANYKQDLGIDVNKYLIVCVARLHSAKNPLFVAKTIYELKKLRNDFIFAWIGDGDMKGDLSQAIKEYDIEDCFKMLGVRTDIPEILHCSDVFLLPSLFEGMPVSLIEAQSCGCKCFVSDTVTRIAKMGGGGCSYLPIEAPQTWAKAIDEYLSGEVTRYIPKDEVLQTYTSAYMARKIEKAYVGES